MSEGPGVAERAGGAERPSESGGAAPGRGGRMSRQRKTAAVLRLPRGEDLEIVSRGLGVTAATLSVALVCRVWKVARATVYRRRIPVDPGPRQRPGPVGPMPDSGLLERIRGVLNASPFHGEGHRKVWARLRFAGLRTSRHRVLRLMREHGL